MYMYILTLYIA